MNDKHIKNELRDMRKVKLKDLVKINQGLQIPIENRFLEKSHDSLFYITNEFLKDGGKNYYIKNASDSVKCNENDILMTRTGNTGQVVTGVKGVFHNNFFKITYDEKLDKDYLVQYLRSSSTQKQILRYAGISTIPDLNHNDFYRLKIPLYNIQVQKKIGSLLSLIDDLIEQSIELENLYSLIKKSYMQKIFSKDPNLRPRGISDNWKKKQLSDLISYTQPTKFLVKEVTSNGAIPILTPNKSFIIGYTNDIDIAYKAKNNPVIIFDDFTTDHKYVDFDFTMKSSATKILTSKDVDIRFFDYLFESIDYKPESHRRHWIEIFSNFDVSIPSNEEILKITNCLSLIDELINAKRKQREQYELMKKYYLNIIFK